MPDYVNDLLQRYREGILLDTNILLLYFVGSLDRKQIQKFRRTEIFTEDDYDALMAFIKPFSKVVTTPHILTEVSNLLGHWKDPYRTTCFKLFAHHIAQFDERYLPSAVISNTIECEKFGLTDAAIFQVTGKEYLVLTDDLKLYHYLQGKAIGVVNFNHVRTAFWQ